MRGARISGTLVGVACAAAVLAAPASGLEKAPDEVIVQFERGSSAAERAEAREDAGTSNLESLGSPGAKLLAIEDDGSVARTIRELEADPAVRFAEPNTIERPFAAPNDPSFPSQWGLENTGQLVQGTPGTPDSDVDAPEAWDIGTGSGDVVVAVMDSGADVTHPDLIPNLWQNPGEAAGNGVDDDGNGFVDDVNGYDFVGGEDPSPFDATGHGTHVAGTVAAVGDNGLGVTGVSQRASIMLLRVCGVTGCSVADQIQAINYAADNGARLLNGSLGGQAAENLTRRQAIFSHPRVLHVFAAGNEGDNVDTPPATFPCAHAPQPGERDNSLCVAALSHTDTRPGFSNFGPASVDLGAPGFGVLSTTADREHFFDNFNANDFAARWNPVTGNTPWESTVESPLTSRGITDTEGGNYAVSTTYGTVSDPVSVGAVSERGCEVRFMRHQTLGSGDLFRVALFHSAAPAGIQQTFDNDDDGDEFTVVSFPASASAGTLRVRFQLVSDSSGVANGVHIDNVRIVCGETPGPHDFGLASGTSMASPHVAGAGALLASRNPGADGQELRDKILATVDPVGSLFGVTVTGGRLNVGSAMAAMPADTSITGGPDEGATLGARSSSRPRGGGAAKGASATFSYSSNDPSVGFQCSVDDGAFNPCGAGSQTIGELGPGPHSFAVRSVDPRGNADITPARRSFSVESDPPETRITKSPKRRTDSRRAKFRFTADEPSSTFECRIDEKGFRPCRSPKRFKRVKPKRHRFQVRAIDAVGNVDRTAAKKRWRVNG